MSHPRRRITQAVILLAALLLPAMPGTAQDAPSLPGVDFSPLTPAQQQTAMKIFKENGCTCGCNMKVAQCRVDDSSCSRSVALAAQAIQLLQQGKSETEVVKAVFRPTPAAFAAAGSAPKELVFDVPVGDEHYAVGPENAPVTLVVWLDYQ